MKVLEWAVLDHGKEDRPYIARTWPTELEAEVELLELLKYFPKNSVWRERLYVGKWKRLPPCMPRGHKEKKCEPDISSASSDLDQPDLQRKAV